MGAEGGLGALRNMQGLQGGRGLGVGERHGAELGQAQREGKKKRERIQPALIFEMSVGHGRNCNRLLLEGKNLFDYQHSDISCMRLDNHNASRYHASND